MKKLIIVLFAILFAFTAGSAGAFTVSWNVFEGEDGVIFSYKDYPAGYSFPANPAPESAIMDMAGVTQINLPEGTTTWEVPATFTAGQRYVFFVQGTVAGSVGGYSAFVCWSYPIINVIEIPLDNSEPNIQINIYQVPK